jgi:energy-converting hydrogenase B subunit D
VRAKIATVLRMIEIWVDLVLVMTIVWLAWRSLTAVDVFKGVILFIGFGLAMALAWVRLDAPDIALAEAAIGTGLTGALLLDAVRHFNQPPDREQHAGEEVAPDERARDGSEAG